MVTGSGAGIGRAAAVELARRGYRIAVTDVDGAAGKATEAMLDDAAAFIMDVRDPASVGRAVADVVAWGTGIDVLVNNAGPGSTQTIVDTPPDVWDEVFAVNVSGIYNCCRSVLPGMIERGGGVIVNVASVAGLIGLPNRAAYCASKGAVVSLTKAMAVAHVRQGVRVNCVCPGTVDSPWVKRLLAQADDPDDAHAALVARQPIGRLGTPQEVASAIAYLASDEAAFVTGTALVVDGGLMAG
jgi:2-keto-3-deoxy-L-fuconate dehydrogenase